MQWSLSIQPVWCPTHLWQKERKKKRREKRRDRKKRQKKIKNKQTNKKPFIKIHKNIFFYYGQQKSLISICLELDILYTAYLVESLKKIKHERRKDFHMGNVPMKKEQKKTIRREAPKTISIFTCDEPCHPLGRKHDIGQEWHSQLTILSIRSA